MQLIFGAVTACGALLYPGALAAISNFSLFGLSIATIFGTSPIIPFILVGLAGALAFHVAYNFAWDALAYLGKGAVNLVINAGKFLFECCFGADEDDDLDSENGYKPAPAQRPKGPSQPPASSDNNNSGPKVMTEKMHAKASTTQALESAPKPPVHVPAAKPASVYPRLEKQTNTALRPA